MQQSLVQIVGKPFFIRMKMEKRPNFAEMGFILQLREIMLRNCFKTFGIYER